MSGQTFPNLRHAYLLLMVSEGASVRATARRVGLTQPAVTLSLATVERLYGVALFERRPAGLAPTKYGTVLSQRVARCMSFLARAIRKVPREADAGGSRIEKLLRALTIGQLRALVALDLHEGYAGAAESLDLRVPSLHRSVSALEGALGAGLLHREKRGVRLNALGHEIAVLFNLGLEELRSAADEIKEADGRLEGTVTIGTVRAAAAGVLAATVLQLSTRHPAARFNVTNAPYEEMLLEVRGGRLDCMVSTARPNVPSDFAIEELCQTEVRIICRRDHPLAGRREIAARELARYRWIGSPPGTGIAQRFRAMFEEEGIAPPDFIAQSELFELTRRLVLSGEFLALTVRSDFGTDYEHQGLIVLDRRVPSAGRPIFLITRRNWKPTRLQETFVGTLREVVQARRKKAGPGAPSGS